MSEAKDEKKDEKKLALPIPPKPTDRGGAAKTEMILAPLPDLIDDAEGVGEGTMKQAYVPTDITAALREARVIVAKNNVPEHLRGVAATAKKPDGGEPPGSDTDKGAPHAEAVAEGAPAKPPGEETDK